VPAPHPNDWGPRTFNVTGFSAYRLAVPRAFLTFDIGRLRRERDELIGELVVRLNMAGARTIEGILSAGDFNLSSVQARSTRAKHLAQRALADDMDWEGWLSELCFRVIQAERTGDSISLLADVDLPPEAGEFDLHGWTLPKKQPTILFGDGGSAKSLLSLWAAGQIALTGSRVLYADWESDGADHRRRLDKLYPLALPPILYARCERPLIIEADRLRNICLEHAVEFVILDSAAFGCQGPPEAAESAIAYFRALRSLNCGSLLIAHVTKAEDGDKKPFGSGFWQNSARATWHIRRSNPDDDGPEIQVLLSQRKCNTGRLRAPMALSIYFGPDATRIQRTSATDTPEFALTLTTRQRLHATLRFQPLSMEAIISALPEDKPDTVSKTVRRGLEKGYYVTLPNGLIGLKH
jgi:hypothetical protein